MEEVFQDPQGEANRDDSGQSLTEFNKGSCFNKSNQGVIDGTEIADRADQEGNKLLRREAGDLERERDNYRNAYNDLLRKQMEKRTGVDLSRKPVTA